MSLNRLVLVINASYEPVNVVSTKRAMTLLAKDAAVSETGSGYTIKTPTTEIPIPSVIRLTRYKRIPRQNKTVSRKGIFLRDGHKCAYCGVKFIAKDLTLDHVMPRSRGGGNTWENLVASCFTCNNRKKDATPEEAGMKLLKRPTQLSIHSKHRLMVPDDSGAWDPYLFA